MEDADLLAIIAQTAPVNAAEATLTLRDVVVLLAGAVSLILHLVQYFGYSRKVQGLEVRMAVVEQNNLNVNAHLLQQDNTLREINNTLKGVEHNVTVLTTTLSRGGKIT